MKAPVPPANEAQRLAALQRLLVLDSPPSEELDRITRLAARLLRVPVSVVSLVDAHRQWFKSSFGLAARETPRDVSFCGHALHGHTPFVIRDARVDERFADNPLVTGPPHVVAYAGQPIRSLGGHPLGTLCVIDHVPRDFSRDDLTTLQDLAAIVEQFFRDLEMRREAQQLQRDYQRDLETRVDQRTAQLQQEKERLHAVLETATDAYVATDGRGMISGWNAAAEAMFGWRRAEAMGLSILDTIIPSSATARHLLRLQDLSHADSAHELKHVLELSARHRDGTLFPVEVSLTANRFGDDWVISAFLRDITVRKTTEASLRDARRKAEDAMLAAEAANQAKTDFLATMSHEIRTPLNGVIGFNGLLLDSNLTPEQRRHAELARQSGEALLHLLNDFLDFSKIEAGRLELEPVEFDLHLEASHVLALVQEAAHEKGLEIRENINVPHRLRGDAARLRQVLLNLLSNAVKFTPHGHITLCCEESSREGALARICFQVTDTGIGIDPATRDRLFQPFVQADASTTRKFGGTGLGLAICKRLTEAMGGEIGVRSRLGRGSTFWVELPFEILASPGQPLVETETGPPPPQDGKTRCRGRVLVVEDNPVSQLLAAEVFKRLGCQVDVVGNGQEAVELTARLPYNLILMDCDMPVMNGFDATRHIREAESKGRHVPIIAMTASALQGDAEKCLAAGMDDFLSKPLRFSQIEQMVARWMHPPGNGPGATGRVTEQV